MARIRQKLDRVQQFLQRNSELLSVPHRVHRRAIFALSCKRPFSDRTRTSDDDRRGARNGLDCVVI